MNSAIKTLKQNTTNPQNNLKREGQVWKRCGSFPFCWKANRKFLITWRITSIIKMLQQQKM